MPRLFQVAQPKTYLTNYIFQDLNSHHKASRLANCRFHCSVHLYSFHLVIFSHQVSTNLLDIPIVTIPPLRLPSWPVAIFIRGFRTHPLRLFHRCYLQTLAMSTLKRKAGTTAPNSDAKKPKVNGNIASFFGAAPKPTTGPASTAAPAAKFDKEKWVAGLTAEQKELLQLEIDTLHESWLAHLKDDLTTKEFLDLKRFLQRETDSGRKWFPPPEDVYSW